MPRANNELLPVWRAARMVTVEPGSHNFSPEAGVGLTLDVELVTQLDTPPRLLQFFQAPRVELREWRVQSTVIGDKTSIFRDDNPPMGDRPGQ